MVKLGRESVPARKSHNWLPLLQFVSQTKTFFTHFRHIYNQFEKYIFFEKFENFFKQNFQISENHKIFSIVKMEVIAVKI